MTLRVSSRPDAAGNSDASIVVSAYHSERHIDRFLNNVRRFDAELGSTTSVTVELVLILNSPSARESQAVGRLDDLGCRRVRIRTVEVERETLYASWNRGIELATGEVLGFWNVDDCRYPWAVVEAVAGVRAGASLMYFPFTVDNRWRKWGLLPRRRVVLHEPPEFDPDAFRETFSIGPFFMFSRGLYEEVGPFDEQFRVTGDLDWCLRALHTASFTRGLHVAGVFLNELRGLSMSGSQRAIAEHNAIYVRHGLTDLVRPVDEGLLAEYDVHRVRVGSAWHALHGFPGMTETV